MVLVHIYFISAWAAVSIFQNIAVATNECLQSDSTQMVLGKLLYFEQKLAEIEADNEGLRAQNELLFNNISHLKRWNEELDTTLRGANQTGESSCDVLFKAQVIPFVNLTGGQVLVFDNVLHNVGNAYNASTGVFVAPCSGRYLFAVTLLSGHGKYVHAQVMRNKTEMGHFYTGNDANASSGSETYVEDLEYGDKVVVEIIDGKALHGNGWSSFMGVLLEAY